MFFQKKELTVLYIFTHAERESDPNPEHTTIGLLSLSSPVILGIVMRIRLKGVNLVCCGSGKRFKQAYGLLREELGDTEVIYSPVFGVADSRRDDEESVITADGETIPKKQYRGIAEWDAVDYWKLVRGLPDHTVIVTGRDFCSGLKIHSRSCSIYSINPATKAALCIVEAGRHLITGFKA